MKFWRLKTAFAALILAGLMFMPGSFASASSFDQTTTSDEVNPNQSAYLKWTFVSTTFAPDNVAFSYRVNTQPAGLGVTIHYCDLTSDSFTMAGDDDVAGEYVRTFTLDKKTVCSFEILQQYPTGRATLYGVASTDARWTFSNPGGGYTGGDFTPAMFWNYYGGTNSGDKSLAGQDLTTNFVIFNDPPYTDGLITPDFKNWWNCVNITNGGAGSGMSYYVQIDYGTSSPYTYSDKTIPTAPYLPLNSLPLTECPVSPKLATLTPDSYEAVASLYVHYPISGDMLMATSSVFHFSVASGTQVNYPSQETAYEVTCSFDVSDTGTAVIDDTVNGIVNGSCKAGSFLIIPHNSSMERFSSLWTVLKVKPPFGYFTAITGSLDLASGTPTTILTTYSAFAPVLDPLKVGLSMLIYFAGAFWIFHRLRKLDFHH